MALALFGFSRHLFAQTLYDASLGTLPASQGWTFIPTGSATQTITNNAVLLNTSASTTTQAGYGRLAPIALDHTNGFTLLFTVQLHAEIHNNNNRAGFSVIVLDHNKRGVELAFWTNTIFAQTESPLFTHGEDTTLQTSAQFVDYALTMRETNYVLRADGSTILAGTVKDYTAFNGFPNPYRTSDFIFFGDNPTSASAAVSLRKVVLVTPPTIAIQPGGTLCWTGVSNQTYTVESSTNLTNWETFATSSTDFCVTNNLERPQRFFRVVYP